MATDWGSKEGIMAKKKMWAIAYIGKNGKQKLMKYRFPTKTKASYAMGVYQGKTKHPRFTKVVKVEEA